jgi:hypothetical protein
MFLSELVFPSYVGGRNCRVSRQEAHAARLFQNEHVIRGTRGRTARVSTRVSISLGKSLALCTASVNVARKQRAFDLCREQSFSSRAKIDHLGRVTFGGDNLGSISAPGRAE